MVSLTVSKIYQKLKQNGFITEVTANLNSDTADMDVPNQTGLFLLATTIYGEDQQKMFTIYTNFYEEAKDGVMCYGHAIIDVAMFKQLYKPSLMSDVISIINSMATEVEKDKGMFEPELMMNSCGFSPVIFSVGDINTLTVEGDVPGFNVYTRLSHISTGYMITLALDSEVLGLDPTVSLDERQCVINGSNRLDRDNLELFAKLGLGDDSSTETAVAKFVKNVRTNVQKSAISVAGKVLLPLANACVAANFTVHFSGK